ncbi:hypothetical protein PHLGIDRAFT_16420 [Phlebiopsis gigantea 11061_1 CR5-6]|uniref:Uncharacterized protein n=1 Tax=Phlebiopsis gigantea (strain 11061_1 CR5-6) TaxID=745531 RepID=A0A0C3NDJ8_PHLG1|nr:hypothetical protein PHLGIDRAFT_16420 [Phlebiopsis gigantea 11061_1 CR5-6]
MTMTTDRPRGIDFPGVNAGEITETTPFFSEVPSGADADLPGGSTTTAAPATVTHVVQVAEAGKGKERELADEGGRGGLSDDGVDVDDDYDLEDLAREILQTSHAMSHSPRKLNAITRLLDRGRSEIRTVIGRLSPAPQVPTTALPVSPLPSASRGQPPAPSHNRWFNRSPTPPPPSSQTRIAPAAAPAAAAAKKYKAVAFSKKPRPDDYYDNFGLRPPPRLALMLLNNAHLPLTACVNSAIRRLNTDSYKFKSTKWTDGEGQLRQLVDLSSLEAERTLTPDLWREGWRNLFTIMETKVDDVGVDPAIRDMWHRHFDWLCKQRDFNEIFASVLEFDIDQRHQFWTGAEKFDIGVGEYAYRESFRAACDSTMRRTLNTAHRSSRCDDSSSGGRGSSSSVHPYANADRSFRGEGQTGGNQDSRTLCLVCAIGGHAARNCSRTNLPNGRAAFAAWDRQTKRLVAATTTRPLCVLWNIRGDDGQPCGSSCGDHKCAFCGSSDHGASSRRCL